MEKAYYYAIEKHAGQMYGTDTYDVHLRGVVGIIARYTLDLETIQAGWLHDVIEDTDATFNDVKQKFGNNVALMVWACSGEGKNRKEKQASIKDKLIMITRACIVKAADRLANIRRGIAEGNVSKLTMYENEHDDFCKTVYGHIPYEMFLELKNVVNERF